MELADQGEVLQVGGPAVSAPFSEVVGIAPFGRPVAAGVGATAVAVDQRFALSGCDQSGRSSRREDRGRRTTERRCEVGEEPGQ
jgi:hypothetical protein